MSEQSGPSKLEMFFWFLILIWILHWFAVKIGQFTCYVFGKEYIDRCAWIGWSCHFVWMLIVNIAYCRDWNNSEGVWVAVTLLIYGLYKAAQALKDAPKNHMNSQSQA